MSEGDAINLNGSVFEVLWPPRAILDYHAEIVRNALADFDKALKEDEETRRLYDLVKESYIWPYLEGGESEEKEEKANEERSTYSNKRKIPEIVKTANKSLSDAANHMSLVLCEDNRFLFWGDVEGFEIKRIVAQLALRNRNNFYTVVAPHHGTHWHDSLRNMKYKWCVASNGKKLVSHTKPFKEISQRALSTFVNGEITIRA